MASLTPQHRAEEVTGQAMQEGLVNGAMVLVPALGGLYAAMRNPTFVKVTNWQSRTAMVIMPALFAFALTGEKKLEHRMREVAEETEHAMKSVRWAENEQTRLRKLPGEDDAKLRDLYRQSVLQSGVQLVPEMKFYHEAANYVQANPIKVLAGFSVPAVAYIFYGKSGKEHLQLQMKVLHTRVLGQFTVICTLLSVMGLKEMMDRSGRYIDEQELENRVQNMFETREKMLERLEYEQRHMKEKIVLDKSLAK